jgi:quercetin dioxygenase-like cupin family protein
VRFMRMFTGDDGETHFEELPVEWSEREGTRTRLLEADGISFAQYESGTFVDWHTAPSRQYILHLTATVEATAWDGSTLVMEPGDVLLAEDTTGRGHQTRAITGGIAAFVRLPE